MYDKKQMFQATCHECGQSCEVPFRPTSGKPVLCSNCFGNKGDRHQNRSGGRGRFSDRGRSGDRQMHQATCDKCGKDCEVPFKPTAGKPIYCNNCFGKSSDRRERHGGGDRRGGGGNDQISQQLKSLSNKLDRVISLLDSGASKKESASPKPAAEKKIKSKSEKKPTKKKAKKKK